MLLRTSALLVTLLSVLYANLGFAHANHERAIGDQQAIKNAQKYAVMLIENPEIKPEITLNTTWKNTQGQISKKSVRYFIVALENTSTKKVLYVLVRNNGDVGDMNFSGEFDNS